jgi:probable rRNA maturation factor
MNVRVTVVNRQRARKVSAASLERFGRRLAAARPAPGADALAVCLVSDRVMASMNLRYRRRAGTTDVLSFPWEGPAGPDGESHLGDIAISVARAARQAKRAGHGLPRELRLLFLHGYLHLLGYDHETDDGTMRRLERRLVRRLLGAGPRRHA